MRLIPTSLFWASLKRSAPPAPTFGAKFETFVDQSLMKECTKKPVDASLKATGTTLDLVPAVPGGQCERADVLGALKTMRPVLGADTVQSRSVRTVIQPSVADDTARAYGRALSTRLAGGVSLVTHSDGQLTLPAADVLRLARLCRLTATALWHA
jgi:hypothetical protein